MSSPDAPQPAEASPTAATTDRPVGILTVDDEACLGWAARLAVAFAGDSVGPNRPSACGRQAGLPRGVTALPGAAFRPTQPFSGPLFAAIEAMALAARLAGSSAAAAVPDGAAVAPAAPDGAAAAAPAGVIAPEAPDGAAAAAPTGTAPGPSAFCMGLVVPLVRLGPAPGREPRDSAPVVITDHVDLAGRGPLAGRWPADRPRTFPSMSAVYAPDVATAALEACGPRLAGAATPAAASSPATAGEREPRTGTRTRECEPGDGRSAGMPAIYSRLAVAGVADTGRQTAFETEQARAAGLSVAASHLVAPVVIAAYYGLVVAAVGVPVDQ